MTEAVDNGQGDDGPVLAVEEVGDDGAEDGREVDRRIEVGDVGGRGSLIQVVPSESHHPKPIYLTGTDNS